METLDVSIYLIRDPNIWLWALAVIGIAGGLGLGLSVKFSDTCD